jgi:glucosylceramidase
MPARLRRLPSLAALVAVACVAVAAGPCEPRYPVRPAVLVHVDTGVRHQRIDGLGGAAWIAELVRAVPEPGRSELLDRILGDLEPSLVRIKVRPEIEPANDDADPATANAAAFVRPDDLLWLLDELFARADPQLVAALWSPPAWMKTNGRICCGGTLIPGMEAELAELFSVYLDFLADAGHPLDHLSIQNEPEVIQSWDTNTYTPQRYADLAEVVAGRLVADGHTARLVAPDNAATLTVPFFLPPVLAKPAVAARLSAVGFHLYDLSYYDAPAAGPSIASVRAVSPPALPLWMTEFSNTSGAGYGSYEEGLAQAALIHHSLVSGVSAYLIWNLVYWSGGTGEALVTLEGPAGYTLNPKYWTARHYVKYVRPGAVRVEATSGAGDLLASAYADDAAGRLVVVLVNRSASARWIALEGVPEAPPAFVRTTPQESGVEIAADSAERMSHNIVSLPGQSVATLVYGLP